MAVEVTSYLGQPGVRLSNQRTRLFVQHFGGMTPEFSVRSDLEFSSQWVNTHWNPHFRTPFSGKIDATNVEQAQYWGIELMRQAAGTFPCAPTFGPGNDELPPHGECANRDWALVGSGSSDSEQRSVSYVQWSLEGNYRELSYQKWDYLLDDDSTHYSVLAIHNQGAKPQAANLAWHTTLGAPFLERDCLIVNNCNRFSAAPVGTEFDQTTSLEPGAQFDAFDGAPLKQGGTRDLSRMPGFNGHAEFVSGTTDAKQYLWSVCVNPHLGLAYLSVIPYSVIKGQVNATSMNYWIHSGGRDFAPWADYAGGGDRNYALGMEAAIGASCLGLDGALENPQYMGRPSYIELSPDQSATFPVANSIFEIALEPERDPYQQIEDAVKEQLNALDLDFSAFNSLTTAALNN